MYLHYSTIDSLTTAKERIHKPGSSHLVRVCESDWQHLQPKLWLPRIAPYGCPEMGYIYIHIITPTSTGSSHYALLLWPQIGVSFWFMKSLYTSLYYLCPVQNFYSIWFSICHLSHHHPSCSSCFFAAKQVASPLRAHGWCVVVFGWQPADSCGCFKECSRMPIWIIWSTVEEPILITGNMGVPTWYRESRWLQNFKVPFFNYYIRFQDHRCGSSLHG